jgi:type I restriction enzyme, S subunit
MKQGDALSLPKGWEIKKLGEIGKVSMCKRVFKEDTTPEGDIPFYKIGTFGKSPDAFITKERYSEFRSKFSFPKKGDILISASGTIGRRVRYDGEPAYFQDSNIVWIDNNEKQVLNNYLYRFYEICNWQSTKGATISRLYNDNLKQIEIPFPKSLSEQQRIVSILDEAFAVTAKAKANAEQNLKNAKELFESYLQGVFERKGDDWEEQPFENCFKLKSGDNLTAKNMTEGEYPVFGGNGIAGYHNDYNLSGSNVIIGRVGALCGNVRHITENIWLTDNAFKVVDFKFDFDHSFLTYLLNHKDLRSYARQAAQPVISNSSLKDVVLCFPKSKTEQQTIVRHLDALRAETQKLEAVYQKKIADLEELKKSILAKAFSGELKTEKIEMVKT